MANFVLIRDPDPGRRAAALQAITPTLAHYPGLVAHHYSGPDLAVTVLAGPRAPISVSRAPDGAGALLVGDARRAGSGQRLAADALAELWREFPSRIPAPLDGFHLGITWDGHGGVTAGCDLLGLFPAYFWEDGDLAVVASVPEAIARHPQFRASVSALGLAGILVLNNMVRDRPLLEGIRRLPAGSMLRLPARGRAGEVRQFAVPVTTDLEDLGFRDQVGELDRALRGAVERAAPAGEPVSLLLSGGLDSRLLGGVMASLGRTMTALTFGREGDIEVRCARAVAAALQVRHVVHEDAPADPVAQARRMARVEHLGNGFFAAPRFDQAEALADLPQPVVTGYNLDDVIGIKGAPGVGGGRTLEDNFAFWERRRLRWGVPPGVVDRLLDTPGIAAAVVAQVKEDLLSHSPRVSKSFWAASLGLRARHHVGTSLWRTSFFNWPVAPVLDQQLLAAAGALPISTLGERRAEKELLCRGFPALAAAPLDRNSDDDRPLQPRLRWLLGDAVRDHLERTGLWRRRESLYYYRISDFNLPPWREIRQAAEAGRDAAATIIRRDVLDEFLPGPEVPVPAADGIADTNAHRLLVGLILWAMSRSEHA